jgi:hypothetical protein
MSLTKRESFLLEEYKALRQEILLKLEHEFKIHQYTIAGVAFVYAAAFTLNNLNINPDAKSLTQLIWFVPVILVVCGASFYAVYDFALQTQVIYIRQIEAHFLADTKPEGCERWFGGSQSNPFGGAGNKVIIGVIFSAFWETIFWLTLVIFFIERHYRVL